VAGSGAAEVVGRNPGGSEVAGAERAASAAPFTARLTRLLGSLAAMRTGSVDLEELHQAVAARLHDADQLYTRGRRELIELLVSLGRPATIPDLLAAQPRLTQSSLYRNLASLDELGVVTKVTSSDDRSRYELTEDLIGHHHHMICLRCGRVDDFVVSTRTERQIDSVLAHAVDGSGFRPTGHRLDVVGLCAQCV